jgi:tRNA(Ile)-lysidine synthase
MLARKVGAALDAPAAPGRGARVVVGVSGGPDSSALLAALAELGPARGLVLTAGHVDHGLRGEEGAGDRDAAGALAARLGVPFVARAVAVAPGPGLEAGARRARHRALAALADEAGAGWIALAHTEDDQAETVLLRLLRGAGRGGLGAMRPIVGRLWRPLLAVTRADVRRYLAERELPFRIDRSNADLAHARNRLRRLVVPLLAGEFNPRLAHALAGLARRLRDEDDFLAAAATVRAAALAREGGLAVAVAAEPVALARRIVRGWLDGAGAPTAGAAVVERVLGLARGTRAVAVAVPGPARVVREGTLLVRRPGRRATAERFRREIVPGDTVDGPGGRWRLLVSAPRARLADELRGLGPAHARFDADALALPLVVRSPAPGDRVHVPGVGTRKLQDVLVDAKVPRERRPSVPVVVDATGTVLWVAGYVRGAAARITPSTTLVVDGTRW